MRAFVNYPMEFVNKQQPSGMPPHILRLKLGTVVMLVRNLDQRNGLINGTRLIIREMHKNFLICKILTGHKKGNIVAIPRIDLAPSETTLPFRLKRRQFPIIPAFAMTIHKSQGQSYDSVGIYSAMHNLRTPLFFKKSMYFLMLENKRLIFLHII